MKKQLSDEQFDQMMRTLMSDAAMEDSVVNEIADSPTLWWSVQRNINREKKASVAPWPPINKMWRWLIFAVPAAAAAAVLISLFAFQPETPIDTAAIGPVVNEAVPARPVIENANPIIEAKAPVVSDAKPSVVRTQTAPAKIIGAKHIVPETAKVNRNSATTAVAKSTEEKTDFIALSYARNPESGQIVRVKVPSSMMVTLGLVASVEKPSNLVDAEVLVGDDGLTRAIRFIR